MRGPTPVGLRPPCVRPRIGDTTRQPAEAPLIQRQKLSEQSRPALLIITGPCGIGKSWLACALGQKACRDDYSVLYKRLPRMFSELEMGRADGRYPRLFRALTKPNVLILDDWGPEKLNADQRRDLMEIVEERYQNASILITSQLPVDKWHDVIGEPTFADAILDRIVHNAHRLDLDGPSMRKTMAAKTIDQT
ncbi:ATP-binding protein [Magnetospira thiophila]